MAISSSITWLVVAICLLVVGWLPCCMGMTRGTGSDLATGSDGLSGSEIVISAGGLDVEQNAQSDRAPMLFFLFMAKDFMPNWQIWMRFFGKATRGVDYEALLHCQERDRCRSVHKELDHPDLNRTFHLIDTVDSEWCTDLVSPMNALLSAALARTNSSHPNDKFIFLSDTTVPIKSFDFVQKKLTVVDGDKSNFCIQKWPHWAWRKANDVMVKHSQWLVLSLAHAQQSLLNAPIIKPATMMKEMVPVRWLGAEWIAPMLWETRQFLYHFTHSQVLDMMIGEVVPAVRGCADEFWHMVATVGAIDHKEAAHSAVVTEGMNGKPLTMMDEASEKLQGSCDTYAVIDNDDRELTKALESIGTKFGGRSGLLGLRPHIHAGKFQKLSPAMIELLGSSEYLFVRKIDNTTSYSGNTTLVDAFDKLIFSQH